MHICIYRLQFLVRDWQNFDEDWDDEEDAETEEVSADGSSTLTKLEKQVNY